MKFSSQLEEGIFLKRYQRFFADIDWSGRMITAHVPNTGSMKSCSDAGRPCRFTVNDDPNRKLKYTLEMIQAASGAWVGVNTATPNKIVREALEAGLLAHWQGASEIKSEAKISAETRFDFRLGFAEKKDRQHFIEVKNVSLVEDRAARFPDCVSERAQKHLRELMRMIDEGHDAEVVFTIQRSDVETFSPADDLDPAYGRLLRQAIDKGVRVTPLLVRLTHDEVVLTDEIIKVKI